MDIMRNASLGENTAMQIGMRMPKVPHDVPVAKAKNAATMNMMAGRSIWSSAALPATVDDTYSAAPSESVMLFRVHASVRMSIAGTIASKPFMRLLMASSKGNAFRAVKT